MSDGNDVFVLSVEVTSECPLNCPFCYFKRRWPGGAVKWSVDEVRVLAHEACELFGAGNFVMVFGGGEPTTDPALLGGAMRVALDEGSLYTSFTSDGIVLTRHVAGRLVGAFGGEVVLPDAFANFSIDAYKLVAGPRVKPGEVERRLYLAWKLAVPALRRAAKRYGVRLDPEKPPAILRAVTVAVERGWTISFNILLTDDILPLVTPPGPFSPRFTDAMIFLHELLEYADAVQIQFLAPKPLSGNLSITQEVVNGKPVYRGPALPRVAATAYWWSRYGPTSVYADQALSRILGLNVPIALPDRYCAAGARLLSFDPAKHAAPCSFAPHTYVWRPGKLKEIYEKLRDAAPRLAEGCPYL